MKKIGLYSIAGLFLAAGVILGLVLSADLGIENNGHSTAVVEQAPDSGVVSGKSVDVLTAYSNAMVDVVGSVMPSVVNISVTQTVVHRGQGGDIFNDPFFRQFFGNGFGAPREEHRAGLGSGVIVSDDGYILTNYHVVKGADTITVRLGDKREFSGKVVGTDPKTDLAVIKIEDGGLPAIKWGDSDALRVGETVIAVGSPYGLNQTVTSGIVSAKGRANVNIADYEDFIQTDAAINPGNSGGPLINIRGELVGINTAIFSTSGGYQGIGFSIPSNMVRIIMDSLIKDKRVVRGWLGVSIQTIDKELAGQFKLDSEAGALVSDVVEGSPAEKGGIKRGDIIVEFEGGKVKDTRTLRNKVAAIKPGAKASVVVMRDGSRLELTITIGELPGEAAALSGDYDNVLSGVSVQQLTPQLRKELQVPARIKGVLVTEAAQETGFRRGDVILEVNHMTVEDLKDYHEAVSSVQKEESVLVLLYRNGRILYATISSK